MVVDIIQVVAVCVLLGFLVADIVLRTKSVSSVTDTSQWRGVVPVTVLAVYGGVMTALTWVGWLLCVTAAVVLSDRIKIGNANGTSPIERSIITRAMLISEVLLVGYTFRMLLSSFVPALGG